MSLSATLAAPLINPLSYSGLHQATNNYHGGQRPFLDVLFDVSLEYDRVRAYVLQGLSTADFDNLRLTCRSIDFCLTTSTDAGNLRFPPHLIDRCDEIGLPPNIPPHGSCPNPPQSSVPIRACQYRDYIETRAADPHGTVTVYPRQHLVCEVCRRNWHDNIGFHPTGNLLPESAHDLWRDILALGHITVCGRCDREQKRKYFPTGHDGCVCYRRYYKERWLCQTCDVWTSEVINSRIGDKTAHRRRLQHVGNEMRIMPVAIGPANLPLDSEWCPCGRDVSETEPEIRPVPRPWLGNHRWIAPVLGQEPTTKQCVLCCGYIVPPDPNARQPTRRSARLADRRSGTQNNRRHTMLGRSRRTTSNMGSKGFESQGVGTRY